MSIKNYLTMEELVEQNKKFDGLDITWRLLDTLIVLKCITHKAYNDAHSHLDFYYDRIHSTINADSYLK